MGMIASRRAMTWLTASVVAGLVLGVAAGLAVRPGWPAWAAPVALTVAGVLVFTPVLVGGWMLGRLVARHAGAVGVVVVAGLIAAAAGQAFGAVTVAWGGYAAVGLGVIVLVLIGLRHRIAAARRAARSRAARRRGLRRVRRDALRAAERAAAAASAGAPARDLAPSAAGPDGAVRAAASARRDG